MSNHTNINTNSGDDIFTHNDSYMKYLLGHEDAMDKLKLQLNIKPEDKVLSVCIALKLLFFFFFFFLSPAKKI